MVQSGESVGGAGLRATGMREYRVGGDVVADMWMIGWEEGAGSSLVVWVAMGVLLSLT